MPRLITAAFPEPLDSDGAPNEIVFLPEGEHTITPYVDGKPKRVTVKVSAKRGAAIAAKLKADLDERARQNVRPWLDFDHEGRVSAGNPTGFRYHPGKGIVMTVDWSKAGRSAIEGKDYSYFSPSFHIDDKGEPNALPMTGPVGGVVNEPAFRDIPRIAAKAGDPDHPTDATMSKLILSKLGINPAADDAETAALDKIEAMSSYGKKVKELEAKIDAMTKERDDLKKKMGEVEAAQAAERKERADKIITAAIAEGKDKEKVESLREKIEAGDALAIEHLDLLPKKHDGIDKPIVTAADGKPLSTEQRIDAAEAKARAELGSNAGFPAVWARAQEIDPEAFTA